MKLVDFFYQHYPDETSCKTEWIRQRNEQGIVCKKCGHTIPLLEERQRTMGM